MQINATTYALVFSLVWFILAMRRVYIHYKNKREKK